MLLFTRFIPVAIVVFILLIGCRQEPALVAVPKPSPTQPGSQTSYAGFAYQ